MSDVESRSTRRPSASFLVSVAALVVASAGTAVAAGPLITGADIKDESVTGKDIKNRSLHARDLNTDATPLWALVDTDGTLLRGNGVVSVTRTSAGTYFVTFRREVYNSGVAVSLVNESAGDGQVNWRPCANIPGGANCTGEFSKSRVFVNTESSSGVNADRRFSIVVLPGGADFTSAKPVGPAKRGAEGR